MGEFKIKTCVLGMVSTNCYIAYRGQEAVVIDPADNADYIVNQCRELGIMPVAILLTHGHFDHILAVEDLKKRLHVPVYAGAGEAALLQDAALNLSSSFGGESYITQADCLLQDGETVELLGHSFKMIATPGHTGGSVCYLVEGEQVLFSGDTLFYQSFGRTDMPTGSRTEIIRSLKEKLFLLPEETKVYPGHGEPTTIGYEKQHNPAVGKGRELT